ncbi:Nicotinate_phosphoribosyltransferase [Hexamita inflata]|uniref:nicotinate phosphoribosyltransferase n=1 Tax=Hexamita inflata TaxID=28002 RepID=A0AA86UHG2_9EUKA|nr:Nicotinate phosphoribosyltransferase [Hexamita inflata]
MDRISPLLTDQYQLSMVYSYFMAGSHMKQSTFEMFFRTNPFKGSYAIFGGLDAFMEYLVNFTFTEEELAYVKETMPHAPPAFFEYLKSLHYSQLTISAPSQGTVVFANEPLVIVQGPLGFCQLVETTLLVLCNYATLMCTNACRMRVATDAVFTNAKKPNVDVKDAIKKVLADKVLLEFGLRRAQGPNGGLSASRYALIGGFNSTSNVLAAMQMGTIASGTMAHAYILSFTTGLEELIPEQHAMVQPLLGGKNFEWFAKRVLAWKSRLFGGEKPPLMLQLNTQQDIAKVSFSQYSGNEQELSAFTTFAFTQPKNFTALVDTYDTLNSGVPNFVIVACALLEFGIQANGIRLDSGDLAYLSKQVRLIFNKVDQVMNEQYDNLTPCSPDMHNKYDGQFLKCKVVASNDITEEVLVQLQKEGAQVDVFGIGTHLVTCKAQPALGGVYKIVEIDGQARMKMTEDISKATLPGSKDVYRLFLNSGEPYADIICKKGVNVPVAGQIVTCIHPHDELKRVMVKPAKVVKLHNVWIDHGELKYPHKIENGKVILQHPDLASTREYVLEQVYALREDQKRYLNPTPYKVSLNQDMNQMLREMALGVKTVPLIE